VIPAACGFAGPTAMTRILLTLSAALLVTSTSVAAPDPAALAAKIDARIDANLKAEGVTPAAPASDAEFLRRATLDILGRRVPR
jgi:hypothetical protein